MYHKIQINFYRLTLNVYYINNNTKKLIKDKLYCENMFEGRRRKKIKNFKNNFLGNSIRNST